MTLSEMLYCLAYCAFVIGAAVSYRENASLRSVFIMSFAVLLDFMVSMLPLMGVTALKMNLPGTNGVIIFAVAFGFFIWLLFIAAVFVRRSGSLRVYHGMIAAVQIAWFFDFIAFLYGIYKFPLRVAG